MSLVKKGAEFTGVVCGVMVIILFIFMLFVNASDMGVILVKYTSLEKEYTDLKIRQDALEAKLNKIYHHKHKFLTGGVVIQKNTGTDSAGL